MLVALFAIVEALNKTDEFIDDFEIIYSFHFIPIKIVIIKLRWETPTKKYDNSTNFYAIATFLNI